MTSTIPAPEITTSFEGFGVGTEQLGSIQANFLVNEPGTHAREVAVLLNEPAARFLAELLGREDSESFRQDAARRVGELWIRRLAREGRHIDPVIFLSRARMEMAPDFLDEVRRRFEESPQSSTLVDGSHPAP